MRQHGTRLQKNMAQRFPQHLQTQIQNLTQTISWTCLKNPEKEKNDRMYSLSIPQVDCFDPWQPRILISTLPAINEKRHTPKKGSRYTRFHKPSQ